jgi:hypothetical protein
MKTIVLLAFSLMACERADSAVHQLEYTYDANTNLCFAFYALGSDTGSMTYVPCTPEVLKEIQREQAANK